MQKAAKAYFQTQVATTSQGKLLLMLYDGCIKFLNQAKGKIEERDYAQKGILISKALDVINELDSSLNAEKGGDLAENLHKLYFYCSTRLLNANLKMNTAYIDEVIKILTGLRSAYAQIIDTPEATAAAAMTAPVQAGLTNVQHSPSMTGGFPKASAFGAKGPTPKANAFAMQAPNNNEMAAQASSGMQPYGNSHYAKPAQVAQAAEATATLAQPQTVQASVQQPAASPAQGNTQYGNIPQGMVKQSPPASPAQTTTPPPSQGTAPAVETGALDFSGKRLTGAAMYRKIASHNTP